MTVAVRRFVIEGRVLGVGYRAFARRAAVALGVRGFAENRADGSVLVEAFGPPEVLAEFEAELSRGPVHGRVDRLSVSENRHENEHPNGFDIR